MDVGGFHTVTLGCKLNQFDTAAIEGELARRGLAPEADPARASVVIVNTCTVTGKADADARKRIRNLRRANPDCRLLVTGCYAELDAATIEAMDGVDRVFGNRDKGLLPEILDEMGIATSGDDRPARMPSLVLTDGDRGCDGAIDVPRALHFGERSRAFLKVQEGCRLACSYCVIPRVRGESRSVPADEVAASAGALVDAGYREIVLTGVNVGDYGRDLEPRTDLAALLGALLDACGPTRIRLNSLEPLTVTDEIVRLLATERRLAPHLQVPLQSGSADVLRGMRRNYRLEHYTERLGKLRAALPHIGLGADVIVGFPGETEERFRETVDFIAASELNYLHVFSWSPRPGTPAADLPDRVHGADIRDRSTRLRELGARLSFEFRKRFVGADLDAIALAARPDGRMRALTGNFIEVTLAPGSASPGEAVRVHVDTATARETRAHVVGTPDWAGSAAPTVRC